MSANCVQLNNNEDSEVMVRQVNLAAAFHDHISCTKISQHSIAPGICDLQTSVSDIGDQQNASIGPMSSELSTAFESDHIYATESKPFNDNNSLTANGCVLRANSLFGNSLSDERNQISKLTEMILGQLDLIQHQQEQLLKKDRQLQGLKQDREALCLRLEKMEKRIAVLTAKVANNNNTTNVINNYNNNTNNIISTNSLNNNTININRNIVNNSQTTTSNTIETDCEQSGSDTIVEETNSVVGLFTDPTVFSKLYSNTSGANSCNSSVNTMTNSAINSKLKAITTTSSTNSNDNTDDNSMAHITIKTEIQEPEEQMVNNSLTTTTSSSTMARKSRKRQPEVLSTTPSTALSTSNRKRSKRSNSSDITTNDIKKEIISTKETSCDSLSTISTAQTFTNNTINKTSINNNKKKLVKLKCETSSRQETTQSTSSSSLNYRNISLVRDVLLTSKPYAIVVNSSHSPLEICVNISDAEETVDNKSNCEEENRTSEVIEVPKYRLHPVSSCYSLEGTENLDDEVFNRRHQKLENDERRRKRWDIQRLREHRYNEKLRTGRYYNSSLNNSFVEKPSDLKKKGIDFKSFYPEIKNLQAIEVSEKIPFIAFGHPIPKMPVKLFSLPWNTSEKTQSSVIEKKSTQKKN